MRVGGGSGTLAILAIMLAASGALRFGSGVGVALARDAADVDNPVAAEPMNCPAPPLAVAEALTDRETRLVAREAALEERLAALDLAEAAIGKRLEELTAAETELKALVTVADGAAEADLARLTVVYEAMKPADAARLFTAMSPDFAAGFLSRMKPESAAAVLSGMTPEAAFTVTALIAGRNARAPTQ